MAPNACCYGLSRSAAAGFLRGDLHLSIGKFFLPFGALEEHHEFSIFIHARTHTRQLPSLLSKFPYVIGQCVLSIAALHEGEAVTAVIADGNSFVLPNLYHNLLSSEFRLQLIMDRRHLRLVRLGYRLTALYLWAAPEIPSLGCAEVCAFLSCLSVTTTAQQQARFGWLSVWRSTILRATF